MLKSINWQFFGDRFNLDKSKAGGRGLHKSYLHIIKYFQTPKRIYLSCLLMLNLPKIKYFFQASWAPKKHSALHHSCGNVWLLLSLCSLMSIFEWFRNCPEKKRGSTWMQIGLHYNIFSFLHFSPVWTFAGFVLFCPKYCAVMSKWKKLTKIFCIYQTNVYTPKWVACGEKRTRWMR